MRKELILGQSSGPPRFLVNVVTFTSFLLAHNAGTNEIDRRITGASVPDDSIVENQIYLTLTLLIRASELATEFAVLQGK